VNGIDAAHVRYRRLAVPSDPAAARVQAILLCQGEKTADAVRASWNPAAIRTTRSRVDPAIPSPMAADGRRRYEAHDGGPNSAGRKLWGVGTRGADRKSTAAPVWGLVDRKTTWSAGDPWPLIRRAELLLGGQAGKPRRRRQCERDLAVPGLGFAGSARGT